MSREVAVLADRSPRRVVDHRRAADPCLPTLHQSEGVLMETHNWPAPGEHMWSPWKPHSRAGGTFYQSRTCVHPQCNESEQREAPKS